MRRKVRGVLQLTAVVRLAPQILLKSIEEVEEKFQYIFYQVFFPSRLFSLQMFLEGSDFVQCATWSDKSLEEIMMRHEFLNRTGKYVLPDPKRPQIKKVSEIPSSIIVGIQENPPLYRILDTDPVIFATQVCLAELAGFSGSGRDCGRVDGVPSSAGQGRHRI